VWLYLLVLKSCFLKIQNIEANRGLTAKFCVAEIIKTINGERGLEACNKKTPSVWKAFFLLKIII
jgi:hypothetical protein